MMGKKIRTVSQITAGLQKMLDELSVSEAKFEEQRRENEAEIQKREAQNRDIATELETNQKVSAKFKDLLGGE